MFVYSIKSKQIKLLLLILFIVISVVCLFVLARDSGETVDKNNTLSIKAATHEDRMSFLSQFGWDVDEEPIEVTEVIIPAEFDDVYTNYNAIQTAQGFDLTVYAGMRVKRWTYAVKNYAGYENKNCVRVNVLVYDGKVIGGDVCSVELDGFMHGFEKPTTDS